MILPVDTCSGSVVRSVVPNYPCVAWRPVESNSSFAGGMFSNENSVCLRGYKSLGVINYGCFGVSDDVVLNAYVKVIAASSPSSGCLVRMELVVAMCVFVPVTTARVVAGCDGYFAAST